MLEIVNIESGYNSLRVIKGISLEVPKSKLVTIIGPNGHGKTTLLRSISGVLRLQSGEINFEGKRIDNLRVDEIVHKGIVHIPQGDMLFPEMNVKDNLLMGAYLVRNQPELKNRITQVLELFPQLGERENQIASTLSGGERRMLAIGRGLMTGAKILLIDEPSLGLAPVVIDNIFKILKELNNQGQTILLVEENVSRVINVSDHIYLIDDGLIAWQGTGEELSSESNIMEVYLGV
tara:strand:+ start:4902 stop:5606 length:705 start_codon:yes stop_codon:yes gene_type:complete